MRDITGINKETLHNTHSVFFYFWNHGDGETIPEEHYDSLEQEADQRINDMVKDGCWEGELICELEEEVSGKMHYYSGYWRQRP